MDVLADEIMRLTEGDVESLAEQRIMMTKNKVDDQDKSGTCREKNAIAKEAENREETQGPDCPTDVSNRTEINSSENWANSVRQEMDYSGTELDTDELTGGGCGMKRKCEEIAEDVVEVAGDKSETSAKRQNTNGLNNTESRDNPENITEQQDTNRSSTKRSGTKTNKFRKKVKNIEKQPNINHLKAKKNVWRKESQYDGDMSDEEWLETVINMVENRRITLETERLNASKSGVKQEGRRVDEERFLEDLLALLMAKENRNKKSDGGRSSKTIKPEWSKSTRNKTGLEKSSNDNVEIINEEDRHNEKALEETSDDEVSDRAGEDCQNDTTDSEMDDEHKHRGTNKGKASWRSRTKKSFKCDTDPESNKESSRYGTLGNIEIKKELYCEVNFMEESFDYDKDTDNETKENVSSDPQTEKSAKLKVKKTGGVKKILKCGTEKRKSLDNGNRKKRERGRDGLARRNRNKRRDTGKTFQCSVCNKTYSRGASLKMHMATHTGVKEHACHLCDKAFARKCYLQQHLLWHAGIRNHECNFCHKRFMRKSTLQNHLAIHTGKKIECPDCDKRFAYKYQLVNHSVVHTAITNSDPTAIKTFQCKDCGKRLGSKTALDLHAVVHSSSWDFMCHSCGKLFKRKSSLKVHKCSNTSGSKPAAHVASKSKSATSVGRKSKSAAQIASKSKSATNVGGKCKPAIHGTSEAKFGTNTGGKSNFSIHVGSAYNTYVSSDFNFGSHVGTGYNLPSHVGSEYNLPTHSAAEYNLPTHSGNEFNLANPVGIGYNLHTHVGGAANFPTPFMSFPGSKMHTAIESGGKMHTAIESGGKTHAVVESAGRTHTVVESGDTTHAVVESGDTTHAVVESGDTTHAVVESGDTTHAVVESGDTTHTQVESGDPTHAEVNPGGSKESVVPPDSTRAAADQPPGNRFICDYCSMEFAYKGKLNKHLIKHTKSKDYQCQTCGKAYSRSTTLRRHCLVTHPTVYQKFSAGKWVCDDCGKVFNQKYELDYHWSNIHSIGD